MAVCRKWYGAYLNPVAWTVYGLCTSQLGDVTGEPVALDNGGTVRQLTPAALILGMHHCSENSVQNLTKSQELCKPVRIASQSNRVP